jgi:hypothetical protein
VHVALRPAEFTVTGELLNRSRRRSAHTVLRQLCSTRRGQHAVCRRGAVDLNERAAAAHVVADAERAYDQAHDKYDADKATAKAADAAARAANPNAAPHAAKDVNAAAADVVPALEKALADAKRRASVADPTRRRSVPDLWRRD